MSAQVSRLMRKLMDDTRKAGLPWISITLSDQQCARMRRLCPSVIQPLMWSALFHRWSTLNGQINDLTRLLNVGEFWEPEALLSLLYLPDGTPHGNGRL